jgi:serine protease Do
MKLSAVGTFFLLLTAFFYAGDQGSAQTAVKPAAEPPVSATAPLAPQKKRRTPPAPSGPLIVETVPTAPQVVTLLHRLSGLKMFRLLLRSSDVRAIARLDDSFTIDGDVHTNVIAGLALDDGETIAAWLPEVDAEIGPPIPPVAPKALAATAAPRTGAPGVAGLPGVTDALATTRWRGLFDSADLTVIARDRRRLTARYLGLDGVTGLSVLKLGRKSLSGLQARLDAREGSIATGQRVHLFGPEPAPEAEGATTGPVYVRIGETEGTITNVMRAPSGGIARLEIRSPRLSDANIGGVAINDAGETLGIVDAVKGTTATILPTALIKGAAKRVLERQASVPRPWLGIRGEPLGAFPIEQLLQHGWESEMARSLANDERRGILLTSVAPGSPAFKAALKPGDLILRVNEDEIRTADDFSWILEEAGPGSSLRFTIARPGNTGREAVEVKLSESPDPFFGLRPPGIPQGFEAGLLPGAAPKQSRYGLTSSLVANGIETIALKPRVAARLGSSGGLLVVYVQPESVAFKAGLRAGDVMESINGQQLSSTSEAVKLVNRPGSTYTCNIVRNKQKMVLTVVRD